MNRTLALFALVIFGFTSLGLTLYDRFSTGKHTRVTICEKINGVKKILSVEHVTKLERARERLMRTEAFLDRHPNGIPGISRQDILAALVDIRKEIRDEKTIIKAVQPDRCG